MKNIVILLLVVLSAGCKKIAANKTYTIRGQIFESSSNPIPVSGYNLSFYQLSIEALLGAVSGFDKTMKTGRDGSFVLKYRTAANDNNITITGIDTVQYKGLYPEWFSITALTDVNLNRIFLFKKIDQLVRKVQFNNALNSGEVLEVITTNSSGANYSNIAGPVSAGTILTVDTIANCKISRFNILKKEYVLLAVLKKPSYQKDLNVVMFQGDETYREVVMTY